MFVNLKWFFVCPFCHFWPKKPTAKLSKKGCWNESNFQICLLSCSSSWDTKTSSRFLVKVCCLCTKKTSCSGREWIWQYFLCWANTGRQQLQQQKQCVLVHEKFSLNLFVGQVFVHGGHLHRNGRQTLMSHRPLEFDMVFDEVIRTPQQITQTNHQVSLFFLFCWLNFCSSVHKQTATTKYI